jgi:hypothetical protein
MPVDRAALNAAIQKAAGDVRGESLATVTGAVVAAAVRFLADRIDEVETRLDAGPFKFMGVYTQGQDYQKGHVVTDRGSLWHCNLPTRERPGTSGSYAWTLCVKRGNDGRDARG